MKFQLKQKYVLHKMNLQSIFVMMFLKIVSAIFANILPATGINKLFDWNLKIPEVGDIFHAENSDDAPQDTLDSDLIDDIKQSAADNLYFLFTRKNPVIAQRLYFNNVTSIEVSYFNPNVPSVVIAHGWTGNQNANLNLVLRDALLTKNYVNVIVLDWCRLAFSNYITSAAGVPLIGQGLGMFLEFLSSTTGISYNQIHLIGFSLGAHVVGNAGRHLGGKVAKITALDPAGPLWYLNPYCISKNDAVYVEVIHTNAGLTSLGLNWDVGHTDFYPNGGGSQPGCDTNLCSHQRAWEILAAAILHEHLFGKQCENQLQLLMNICSGKRCRLGNSNLKMSESGVYRFNTNMYFPYIIQ